MKKLKEFEASFIILLTFFTILYSSSSYLNSDKSINSDNDDLYEAEDFKDLEIAVLNPRSEVSGVIPDRKGKIFTNITTLNRDSYINRYKPGLSNQPNLFLQNWNITQAKMVFENITAVNYTKSIETDPTEFIMSYSFTDPIYAYQKFFVETDQYVNNISIFIQDLVDEDYYSDENSWEVSIVNCSNDLLGTPNSEENVGTLQKPHPVDMVAHWEVFNFKDSEIGPIFLNTSITNWTLEVGLIKYWFAIKIKIPPNDGRTGGGPKFLYFNPDSSGPNEKGEGETFAQSPQFINLSYFLENVIENQTIVGDYLNGNVSSFQIFDQNRFAVKSISPINKQIISLTTRFEIENLTNTEYTWDDLKIIKFTNPLEWKNILNSLVFSLNFSVIANVSDNTLVETAWLSIYNPFKSAYIRLDTSIINLTHQYELLQYYTVIDPEEKLFFIQMMNTSFNGNNSLTFRFEYNGLFKNDIFNCSINLFNVEIGEIIPIQTIQKYDPIVHELHYTNNVTLLNSTFNTANNDILDVLKENDDNFLEIIGDSDSNTTIIDFEFNVLPDLDSSLWDVDDPLDWIFRLPDPRIYQIDFRISSNVSIQDSTNLTHAMLEVYNGGDFTQFYGIEWLQFTDNKTFADIGEDTKILPFDSYYSWYIMHLLNESKDNSLRVRLRFIGNGTFKGINVSIDEFTLNFHIQNAISSDIASKIGFGINSNTLKPSYIQLQNFGIDVSDNGLWEMDIVDGLPVQGFYYFNVSSLWPEIRFDVSGIYTIESDQKFSWEYILGTVESKILWNLSTDISYYSFYNNLDYSQGLQFNIPSDWMLMDVYNYSNSPPTVNGGWYSKIQSSNSFNIITVYNISDGDWKISMNSSKSLLLFNTNSTNDIFLDKIINIDLQIQDYYGGDVYFEIYHEDSELIYINSSVLNELANESTVSYIWDIFSTTKAPGTYYLKGYWILYNDTHAYLAINTTEIVVSKYTVDLQILNIDQFSSSYIYGKDILIGGRLRNHETGMVIEGESIIAEIYDNDQNLIETKSDITNNRGIIQIEYRLPSGYNGISITLVYNTSNTYYSQGVSAQAIEFSLISQTDYYFNIFMEYLPYIGAILGILIFTFGVVKYRKRKLNRIWADDSLVLDDLVKISYILIISKEVGVSIYSKQISFEDFDSDLISGFLQAISVFKSEIKKSTTTTTERTGFEMDYYDFKIVITDGEFIRVALVLEGIPSEKLKENQWSFTENFEKRFTPVLKDFTGDITPFRQSDDLIEKHFNISLVYPLQLSKHHGVTKLKGLEKDLIEMATEIQKERKVFFISSLLNLALAARKASLNEIISTILALKEKGLITPVELE